MRNGFGTLSWAQGVTIGLVVGVLASASPVQANHIVQACGDYCTNACPDPLPSNCRQIESGRCELGWDINCTNGQNIRLQGGANLDLHGHAITCTSSSCGTAAVAMEAASSKVYNTVGEGVIQGPFSYGVTCGGFSSSEVVGITIKDVLFGIYNCRKVENNVLTRAQVFGFGVNVGVYSAVYGGTDYIRQNLIQDRSFAIWLGSGNFAINVEDNAIETTVGATGVGTATAFNLDSAAIPGVFRGNVILGGGSTFYGPPYPVIFRAPGALSQASFASNICGRAHPDCTNCQTLGYCVQARSPFSW